MLRLHWIVLSALLAVFTSALVSSCSSGPVQGAEGQACYPNGTCNAGLTCLSKLCVNTGTDAGSGDSGIPADAGNADSGLRADAGSADSGTTADAGSSDSGSPDAGSPDAGPPDAGPPDAGPPDAGPPDAGPPPPPNLGVALDRAGRPGVNLLLTAPFVNGTGVVQDDYNAADASTWSSFSPSIRNSLGVWDGIDTVCGNQFLAGSTVVSTRYQTLADLFDDDRLYVNTSSTTCVTYLGVEFNATVMANTDCGGFTPLERAMDTTYSVLTTGQPSGVSNGITQDADGTASTTMFPYLAAPN